MKTFKILLILFLLVGCLKKTETLYNYKGYIVYGMEKYNNTGNCYIDIKKDTIILNIKIHKYDWNKLYIGDTIK